MKTWKRIMALALAAAALPATLAGCGGQETVSKDDGSEQVTLKWVYMGDMQDDTQKVWDKFNERLADYLPNTRVEFEAISGADYAEKWRLKMASQETVDIAWTGYVNTYTSEIANGAFMELDGLLDEYGQELKAELPDWVWEKAKYDGKIYSVPNYQMMNSLRLGLILNKDQAEQYLSDELEQKIIDTTYSHEFTTAEDYDVIEEYLKILKDNNALQKGVNPENIAWLGERKGYDQLLSETMPFVIKKTDESLQVLNVLEQDSMKVTYQKMHEWFEKGYIRKDIASTTDEVTVGSTDDYTLHMHGYYELKNEDYEGKTLNEYYIPCEPDYFISCSQSNTSTVIPTTAAHPERAMQLITLMNTPKGAELLNLLSYGIEGEHYTKIDENTIDTSLAVQDNVTKYSANCWVLGNTFVAYETNANPPGWNQFLQDEVNGKAIISPAMGFKPNLDSLKTYIAQVTTVIDEYGKALKQGSLPDWEEKYNEMIEKMKTAGSDKIIEELQRQIDEWAAEYKNQ